MTPDFGSLSPPTNKIYIFYIFEVLKNNADKMAKIIRDEMMSVKDSEIHSFSIPLLVDVNIGDNWGLLH